MLPNALVLWLAVASPASDTVRLQFVGHSGWMVSVRDVSVLIDPVRTSSTGRVELSGLPSVSSEGLDLLIVTHGHPDHYSEGYVRLASDAGVPVAVGHDIDSLTAATVLTPRSTTRAGGVELTSIQSTDAGVGVVVGIGSFRIYHSGDHALWAESSRDAYQAEIDWLAETIGPVDVVLAAVSTGQTCEVRPSLLDGVRYAAMRLNARLVVPMHLQCLEQLPAVVEMLRASLGPDGPRVAAPRQVGDTLKLRVTDDGRP
jgi:L-ascorbate metabolism protein UlaG (beta-lactamase superfamily)